MIQINMDLPKSCEECPCCQPDAHHWFYSCGVTGEDVMDSERSEERRVGKECG